MIHFTRKKIQLFGLKLDYGPVQVWRIGIRIEILYSSFKIISILYFNLDWNSILGLKLNPKIEKISIQSQSQSFILELGLNNFKYVSHYSISILVEFMIAILESLSSFIVFLKYVLISFSLKKLFSADEFYNFINEFLNWDILAL